VFLQEKTTIRFNHKVFVTWTWSWTENFESKFNINKSRRLGWIE
jgi:hypothetical protein